MHATGSVFLHSLQTVSGLNFVYCLPINSPLNPHLIDDALIKAFN